jgi:hypothetical protein
LSGVYVRGMSAKVVPLRQPGPAKVPTTEDLIRRIRVLAATESKTRHVHFNHPHFQLRLDQRGLNMRLILETLREGVATGKPTLDPYGDWRIKLRRTVAGRTVQVVVAVKEDHLVMVTAI